MRMDFPEYTLRDSLNADYRLLKDYLGIGHIRAAVGASMGAMKALQLAISYPDYASGIVSLAGTAATNAQVRVAISQWMETIELDAAWYGGRYDTNPTRGVVTAFMNFLPWLYTNRWFATTAKTVEQRRALIQQTNQMVAGLSEDTRDVHYQWRAWANFDVGETAAFKGDTAAALKSIKADVLVIGAKEDLLFTRDEALGLKNGIRKARYVEIDSPAGHLFVLGVDPEAAKVMEQETAKFVARLR
jgi:homoserine O-acetyltransferase